MIGLYCRLLLYYSAEQHVLGSTEKRGFCGKLEDNSWERGFVYFRAFHEWQAICLGLKAERTLTFLILIVVVDLLLLVVQCSCHFIALKLPESMLCLTSCGMKGVIAVIYCTRHNT